MSTTKLKLKAIGLSFLDEVVPSIVIVGLFALTYLFYLKIYSSLFLDTINVYSVIGTILMLPAGIFAIVCFLAVSYSFFKVGLNQAIATFSFGNSGGFSIYETGGRFVFDNGNISIMQMLLGMFLFVLIVPFAFLFWIIKIIRIAFSKKYAEAILGMFGNGISSMFVPSLLGAGACVFGLLVWGLKGIQYSKYNPYKAEPYITKLAFHGIDNYSASLSFDFDTKSFGNVKGLSGSLILKDPNSNLEEEYKKLSIIGEDEFYLPGITIQLDSTTDNFKSLYTVGFDNLDYYFKVKSAEFNNGSTNISRNYSIKLNTKDYEYTSSGSYFFS